MQSRTLRSIIDVLLLVSAVAMGVTGIIMYFKLVPDKHVYAQYHSFIGFSLFVIVFLHVILNWKPLKSNLSFAFSSKGRAVLTVVLVILLLAFAYIYATMLAPPGTGGGGWGWRGGRGV